MNDRLITPHLRAFDEARRRGAMWRNTMEDQGYRFRSPTDTTCGEGDDHYPPQGTVAVRGGGRRSNVEDEECGRGGVFPNRQ